MNLLQKIKLSFLTLLETLGIRKRTDKELAAYNNWKAAAMSKKAKKLMSSTSRSNNARAKQQARRAFIAADALATRANLPRIEKDPKKFIDSLKVPPKVKPKVKRRNITPKED